jgi:hypothetical protein
MSTDIKNQVLIKKTRKARSRPARPRSEPVVVRPPAVCGLLQQAHRRGLAERCSYTYKAQ